MGVTAGIVAVGTVAGGAISADASRRAGHTQADAAKQNIDTEYKIFEEQKALEKPFIDAGTAALPQLQAGVAPGGQFNKPYTLADFKSGPQSGLYDFAKAQGTEALTNQLDKMGLGNSTNDLAGIGKLTTNLAGSFYDTGFNQNLQQNNLALNSLSSLLGIGQNATGAVNNNLTNLGTGVTNANTSAGNANAGGIIGQGNAVGGAVSSVGQDAANAYLLKSYFATPGTASIGAKAGSAPGVATAPPLANDGQYPLGTSFS